jgi:hypothetical protein
MALVRCPGCKLDTSDSLVHCPSCGTALHGPGPKLFDPQPGAAMPTAPAASPSRSGPSIPIGSTAKAIGAFVVLLVVALVPHGFALLVVFAVLWILAKRTGSAKPSPRMEALRIFVDEASRARSVGSKERPLEMLRRIEQQVKTRPKA